MYAGLFIIEIIYRSKRERLELIPNEEWRGRAEIKANVNDASHCEYYTSFNDKKSKDGEYGCLFHQHRTQSLNTTF
jgi:hypothetical protein